MIRVSTTVAAAPHIIGQANDASFAANGVKDVYNCLLERRRTFPPTMSPGVTAAIRKETPQAFQISRATLL